METEQEVTIGHRSFADGKTDGQRVQSATEHQRATGKLRKCQACGTLRNINIRNCAICNNE